MATQLRHLRSGDADKRPAPEEMVAGQIAINYSTGSPGLFFRNAAGAIQKVGPTHIGLTAPNSSPAGSTGVSVGESWLDTSLTPPVFKIWDGVAWVTAFTPGDLPEATETVKGVAELATQAEVDAGTNATDIVTPATLRAATLGSVSQHTDVSDALATDSQALMWTGSEWAPGNPLKVSSDVGNSATFGSDGGIYTPETELVHVGETPPDAPADGWLWFRTDICQLFVYYDDGDTQQWVQANSGASGGGGTSEVYVADNPPDSPAPGALWFRSTMAQMFIWYDDGMSLQWVQTSTL